MQKLDIIIHELESCKAEFEKIQAEQKNSNRHKVFFYRNQIKALVNRLRKFGQRSVIVKVIVSHGNVDNKPIESEVYLTDVSEEDAIKYIRTTLEVSHKIHSITAYSIQPGKLYKKVF